MKPKTLVVCVLAVLLIAAASWRLVDHGQADVVRAPQQAVADAPAAAVLPEPVTAAATIQTEASPPADPAPPARKLTPLPDGTILIENHPITVRYGDGRVEHRLVRMLAKPTTKPLVKRVLPTTGAAAAPKADDGAAAPAQTIQMGQGALTTTGSAGASGSGASPAGSGDQGGDSGAAPSDPAGGASQPPSSQPPKTNG